jgi:hypothetical protein
MLSTDRRRRKVEKAQVEGKGTRNIHLKKGKDRESERRRAEGKGGEAERRGSRPRI